MIIEQFGCDFCKSKTDLKGADASGWRTVKVSTTKNVNAPVAGATPVLCVDVATLHICPEHDRLTLQEICAVADRVWE